MSVNLITSSISAITGKWSRLLIAGESVNLHNHFGTPDNAEDVHLITQLLLFNYPSQIKTSCAGPGSRMLTAAWFLIELSLVVYSCSGIVSSSYNEWSRTTSINVDKSQTRKSSEHRNLQKNARSMIPFMWIVLTHKTVIYLVYEYNKYSRTTNVCMVIIPSNVSMWLALGKKEGEGKEMGLYEIVFL